MQLSTELLNSVQDEYTEPRVRLSMTLYQSLQIRYTGNLGAVIDHSIVLCRKEIHETLNAEYNDTIA